ncbi:MAG: hypothetical protein ACERKZ_09755 [Lachnotalea sp.]
MIKRRMKTTAILFLMSLILTITILPNNVNAATTRTNQSATADYDKGDLSATGIEMEIGYCAVHYKNGNPLNPVIPFGTYLYIDNISSGQGKNMDIIETSAGEVSVWRVEDTGSGSGKTTYWVDFFLEDYNDAVNFGTGTVTYHY